MIYKLVLSFLFLATALAIQPKTLPSRYPLCKRSDPEISTCLKSAIQTAIGILCDGDKELGISSLDPLRISKLSISQGSGPVAVNLTFLDLDIHGIRTVVIDSVQADLEGPKPELNLTVSTKQSLMLKGKYEIDGNVLVLSINGNGDAQLGLYDVIASIGLKFKKVKKNNHIYAIPQELIFRLDPKNVTIQLDNLYNGNKELGDHMNLFLNEQWPIVYGELQDPMQRAFAGAVVTLCTRLFSKIPFDLIFMK